MGMFADLPDVVKERQPTRGMFADLPNVGEKPIGFIEAAIQDPLKKLAFSGAGVADIIGLAQASKRMQTDDYETIAARISSGRLLDQPLTYPLSPAGKKHTAESLKEADVKLLTDHFEKIAEQERRGYTLMGRVGQIVSQMPAFMVEFLATGGIARLGSKAAQEIGEKILKESAKKGMGKAVVGMSKFAVSAGARAAAMPHRGAEAILKRQLPKGITVNNLGEAEIIKPDEKVWTSIWKGALDHYIEIASEQAGEFMGPAINKVVGKLPFIGKAIGAMQRAWLNKFPTKSTGDFTKKTLSKVGFHGILSEVGEEDLGWIARAIFNVEDYGAGPDASIGKRLKAGLAQDIQNLPAELIAFAIPGVVGKGVTQLFPEMVSNLSKDTQLEPDAAAEVVRSGMEAVDAEATVEEQTRQFTEAAEKAFMVERKISRFPGKITDAASLKKIGTDIAKDFGVDVEGVRWIYKTKAGIGTTAATNLNMITGEVNSITMRVGKGIEGGYREVGKRARFAGMKPGQFFGTSQSDIKRTIMHELGHIAKKPILTRTQIRGHHPAFAEWVNENVPKLLGKVEVEEGKPRTTALGKTLDMATKPREYQVIEFDVSGKEKGPVQETFDTEEEAQAYAETMTESSFTPGMFEVRMAKKPEAKLRWTKKRLLARGHQIPRQLKMSEKERKDLMHSLTGKRSMKDMNKAERIKYVEELEKRLKEAGIEYEEEGPSPHKQALEELTNTLAERKVKVETPIEKLNRGGVYKIIHGMKSLSSNLYQNFMRVERLLEGLDGHKEGAFTKNIWQPIKEADEFAVEATNNSMREFISHLEEQGIDVTLWLGHVDEVGPDKIRLTASQRIGIYNLSKNKNGMRYLVEGMGFSPDNIKSVIDFMSKSEKTQGDWLLEQYEQQWPVLKAAAIQAGIDPKVLKKEFRYSPILRTDADLEQQTDFLSGLADQYTRDSFSPEKRMLEQRKPGARGEIELDAFVMYMHNIARTERFKAMASTAAKVGKILNDKNFKRELNAATYGHGSKILSTWLRDTIRGTSTRANTLFQKGVAIARRNGVVYAIGYNLPSAMRQTLSMNNAIAADKLMLKYIPLNMTKAVTPKGYAALEQFVYNRSLLVKTRSFERDLRQKWNKSSLKKKLKGKAPWSKTATSWIRWMDKHTVVVAWKSLYDTGIEKFNGDENKAKEFADKWVGRTQPMANTKDLPQFFRGGSLEKLITTFQNQINQNGNFYLYDIIGAKRAGEINWKTVGYRTMFSYVLPAMLFGMIGRARPPKNWKDVLVDLSTYPVAPLLLVGRWIDRMIRGWGQSGTIAEAGPEAAIRTVEAAKRGDLRGFMFGAARTIGAFTGTITAQMTRTVEGALDLLAGSTKDPRRLIYSKWALEQGVQKEVKRGARRRTRRNKPTRRTRRRR